MKMKINLFISVIIAFIKAIITDTKAAYASFKTKKAAAKEDKKAIMQAETDFIFDTMKIFLPRVILPLVVIVSLICFIKMYFTYIVFVGFLVYCSVNWLKEQEQKEQLKQIQLICTQYDRLKDFIFDSLRDLAKSYLPAEMPMEPDKIAYNGKYIAYFNYFFYAFQLTKLNPDKVEAEKIKFAEIVLQQKISQKLHKLDTDNPNFGAYYKDMPLFKLDAITDMGSYFLIQIGVVNTPTIYDYFKRKDEQSNESPETDAFDEDF